MSVNEAGPSGASADDAGLQTRRDTPAGAGSLSPDPEQRKKPFYGWYIVGVMASAAAVSMGMGSLNFGLFIKPMGDELGISRATFGWASTARQVSSAGTSPFVGSLLDRFGSRVMLPVSAAITVAAMIGLGYMHSAWQLIALFSLMGLVGMSGPGALVTTVPVMKWFVRNRGKAIAYTSLGVPLGALIFLPLTQVLIDAWGWRTAWIVLGIIGGAIIIPLSIIFVRRQPEDMGLLPDGDVAEEVEEGSDPTAPVFAGERSWTTAEAVRSPVFWRLVAVFSLVALGVGTVGVHRIPAFQDRGLDAGVISIAAALDAVAAGAATFTMGMLVRKVAVRYLGAAGFGFLAIASVLTIYTTTVTMVFASMIVFGLGIGGMLFLQNYIWAEYFGRGHLGSIRGLVMPITLIVGGAGGPVAGYVRDASGTYNQIWWAGVALMSLGALIVAFTAAPERSRPHGGGRPPRAPAATPSGPA